MPIYFLTPDYTFPSGGVRVIYRHVDILNKNGIQAYVLHRKKGHRCSWFDNETPIVYWDDTILRRLSSKVASFMKGGKTRRLHVAGGPQAEIGDSDILVLAEILGPRLASIAPGIPRVVLNQNCYLTYRGYPLAGRDAPSPYRNPEVKGVMINSEDGFEYLSYAFPGVPVTRFRLSIDKNLFAYQAEKKRQICFTARKGPQVVRQVINILKDRDALHGFDLVPFSGISQEAVARLMRDSALFLSFGQYEGFGLPPAEAMACGCITIGFHAGGGREFMKNEFSFPVENGDITGFARAIEAVTTTYDEKIDHYREMGKHASQFIHNTYSPENEESDVMSFWRKLLQ